jgi:hypothetical protein
MDQIELNSLTPNIYSDISVSVYQHLPLASLGTSKDKILAMASVAFWHFYSNKGSNMEGLHFLLHSNETTIHLFYQSPAALNHWQQIINQPVQQYSP